GPVAHLQPGRRELGGLAAAEVPDVDEPAGDARELLHARRQVAKLLHADGELLAPGVERDGHRVAVEPRARRHGDYLPDAGGAGPLRQELLQVDQVDLEDAGA